MNYSCLHPSRIWHFYLFTILWRPAIIRNDWAIAKVVLGVGASEKNIYKLHNQDTSIISLYPCKDKISIFSCLLEYCQIFGNPSLSFLNTTFKAFVTSVRKLKILFDPHHSSMKPFEMWVTIQRVDILSSAYYEVRSITYNFGITAQF